jgi:ABC-type ATPase with predicted acetyltransferase domain
MRKPPEPRVIFYARVSPAIERLRRRLQRQLGNPSNSELAERALQALAEDVAEKRQAEAAA